MNQTIPRHQSLGAIVLPCSGVKIHTRAQNTNTNGGMKQNKKTREQNKNQNQNNEKKKKDRKVSIIIGVVPPHALRGETKKKQDTKGQKGGNGTSKSRTPRNDRARAVVIGAAAFAFAPKRGSGSPRDPLLPLLSFHLLSSPSCLSPPDFSFASPSPSWPFPPAPSCIRSVRAELRNIFVARRQGHALRLEKLLIIQALGRVTSTSFRLRGRWYPRSSTTTTRHHARKFGVGRRPNAGSLTHTRKDERRREKNTSFTSMRPDPGASQNLAASPDPRPPPP